ncbi:D-alanyl-D-alanine carboxypeptidase [Streptomyces sp. NPDC048636]|uniref:D-alanyl-D-alanine carboxypeptidase family protein n=1 Tax=Streptomyces sp. NPDC048636 TaxID=3155762 RepID=UPI00342AC235
MAGESPGKSEQQKSSGESARGERDPRLAVFREGEAAGGASAVAVASGSPEAESEAAPEETGSPEADRATAVFRTATDAEGAEGAEGAEDSSDAEAEPEAESKRPDASADGADGEDADDAEADDVRDGESGEGDSSAEEPSPESEPEPEAEAGATASGLPTRPKAGAADQESAKPEGESGKSDDSGKAAAVDAAPEERDARLRQAVAAWVANTDTDADAESDADADGDSGADADDSADAADDKPSAPSVDQRTAVFRTLKSTSAAKAEAKADPEDEDEAKDEAGDDEDQPVDRATAAFGVLPAKGKGAKGKDAKDAKDAKDKDGEGGGKRVDQPTTAFKALSTDRPGTDRPGTDKPGTKKPAAESVNERTSKFVPLRSADAPAAKPAAPASPPAPAEEPSAKPADGSSKAPALPEAERTKQQPLPPQTPDGKQPAPLDLLAQLTNTPPKPVTPMRTMVRRVKIWTPLVLLLVIVVGVAQAVRPLPEPALKLTADATYSFKGGKLSMPWPGQGQSAVEVEGVGSLGTSGAQKPVPIASVTKVMTAYVVLKEHPLKADAEGPPIKIDKTAADESGSSDESRASVKEGQTFTQHQLLQLLLINSSNNIARLLARWDAKTLDAFVKKMNDAAKDLGMKNTTYTDPSGLKATTKSTAEDQLKLAKAAMQSDAFRSVVATPNAQIPGLDDRIYNNNNLLVKPGVIGIKTGSSTPAGGALMWGAEKTIAGKKQRILGVVLKQRSGGTLDESLQLVQTNSYKLITALQNGLTSATVVKKGDVVGHVDDGVGGTTPVVATKDLTAVGWSGLTVDLKLTDGGKSVPHSAKAGTVVGELTVGTGPGRLKAPVALQGDLSEPSFGSKLTRIT